MSSDASFDTTRRVFVAGLDTAIGGAIAASLRDKGFLHVFGEELSESDAANTATVDRVFRTVRPEYVFMAAGRSGGIGANQRYPADLMIHNLQVTLNVLGAALAQKVTKLLYLGSSCAYPKECAQPMAPAHLSTGPLEPTSAPYATAKLAGMMLCDAYRRQFGARFVTCIPANAFGPRDHFDEADSHVIAALIRRMHDAQLAGVPVVTIWGSGRACRDFIYEGDVADACVRVMRDYDEDAPINIGSGTDTSIAEIAALVQDAVGYRGRLEFDASRPDGMAVKRLDTSRLSALGWRPHTALADAVRMTYEGFLSSQLVSR